MDVWKQTYEQLIFLQDRSIHFKAIIAIHNTKLGPALGGCRFRHYENEADAVDDALRLSRSMSYKTAVSGIPYGGGKAVILSSPHSSAQRERLFLALADYIEQLGGRYITGMDLGTSVSDMDWMKQRTNYVTDASGSLGASNDLTATMTAYGVFLSTRAALKVVYGTEDMSYKRVAVQGLGKVGYRLCRYLKQAGAHLIVSDIDSQRAIAAAREFGASVRLPEEILTTACDVLAPCALGGVLNSATIPGLNCRIVVGAANNQLLEDAHGELLHKRGILYAPDYVINAGGIIVTAEELAGGNAAHAKQEVENIYGTLSGLLAQARLAGISPARAADLLAEGLLS
ncbi:Glu/Leu/Phe/Val dehydrogenase [Paenibacillus sp. HB172176]|uniref:Leu/Phe/Val dehydrogenase n=1 Tax=Paenibacillus sp. HB172176 TaxID=2493690 RepID=UPI00143A4350|nr:Glu/Leu/Phe/Val dehydrogenase [Paenibacillus sp. HB172176]